MANLTLDLSTSIPHALVWHTLSCHFRLYYYIHSIPLRGHVCVLIIVFHHCNARRRQLHVFQAKNIICQESNNVCDAIVCFYFIFLSQYHYSFKHHNMYANFFNIISSFFSSRHCIIRISRMSRKKLFVFFTRYNINLFFLSKFCISNFYLIHRDMSLRSNIN